MLTFPAKTVYIDPEVDRKPNCRARLARLLPHVRCSDLRPLDGGAIGMAPDRYICNCGPQSTPGGEVYNRWHAAAQP